MIVDANILGIAVNTPILVTHHWHFYISRSPLFFLVMHLHVAYLEKKFKDLNSSNFLISISLQPSGVNVCSKNSVPSAETL